MTTQREDLLVMIEHLAEKAKEPDQLHQINPATSWYDSIRLGAVAGVTDDELKPLGRAIASHLGLPDQEWIHHRSSPDSSGGTASFAFVGRLVARARAQGVEAALASFEDAIKKNSVQLAEVIALSGINPIQAIDLPNGLRLIPISDLHASLPRDYALGTPMWRDNKPDETIFTVRARPTAAIIHTFNFGPILKRVGDEWPPARNPNEARIIEMRDVARCLTLLQDDTAVKYLAAWYQPMEDNPLISGGGWGGQAVAWGDQFAADPREVDVSLAHQLVEGFFAIRWRERLRIVLDRLNAAKMAREPEDRAVDLGVAIEALLFNPRDVSSEISIKLKYRGAVLYSDDPADRKYAFKLLDQIYSNRSTAAHGGRFDEQAGIEQALAEGIRLVQRIVQNVLLMGFLPESWNGLILGWEQLPREGATAKERPTHPS